MKDLSCLTDDFGRVVLVDNNPFSFLLQPLNGIPCIPFSAGQPHDEQVRSFLQLTFPFCMSNLHLSFLNDHFSGVDHSFSVEQ